MPVTDAPRAWQKLMKVVSGKIVNGYCRKVFFYCRFKNENSHNIYLYSDSVKA
jgi:hypothetical protein